MAAGKAADVEFLETVDSMMPIVLIKSASRGLTVVLHGHVLEFAGKLHHIWSPGRFEPFEVRENV